MSLILMLASSLLLRFGLVPLLQYTLSSPVKIALAVVIIALGAVYPLKKSADLIEGATDTLSRKTKIAAGLLQSVGTALPDMILGVTAALISLSLAQTDHAQALAFAMIAASTTFGSNIYNVGQAAWCILRQNKADALQKPIPMFLRAENGMVSPLATHEHKPTIPEIDVSIRVLTTLTVLTALVALSMVIFGHVSSELYQLVRPAGAALMIICLLVIYHFHKRQAFSPEANAAEQEYPLTNETNKYLWVSLLVAGVTIAATASSMVEALEIGSAVAHIPYVLTGAIAGVFGCLGEMLVVHDYVIHANGRLGDALVGVAMDNIVTILGAAIVAVMGGIFLGSTALIVIFVAIFALNSLLIDQISRLKTTLYHLQS